jgi:ribosome-binding protein aMBF1 (putative translation factor)
MPYLGYTAVEGNETRQSATMNMDKSKKRKRPMTVCDQLREAIRSSGWTHYRVGKQAGIKPEIVTRFAKGERDIRAETFAKIAAALGMELALKKGEGNG